MTGMALLLVASGFGSQKVPHGMDTGLTTKVKKLLGLGKMTNSKTTGLGGAGGMTRALGMALGMMRALGGSQGPKMRRTMMIGPINKICKSSKKRTRSRCQLGALHVLKGQVG